MHFFLQHWREGASGAFVMGAHHGLYCVACCAGLMAALVVLGMMSPVWMALLALVVLLEKVTPAGQRLTVPTGVVLLAGGLAVALGWISLVTL